MKFDSISTRRSTGEGTIHYQSSTQRSSSRVQATVKNTLRPDFDSFVSFCIADGN